MDTLAVIVGKLISFLSKTLHIGAGATWPGEVALSISPDILSILLSIPKKGIIIVAGTNGKTTTTLMIDKILSDNGEKVIHNTSGANLKNGIVSSLLSAQDTDWGIFEVDENALPKIIKDVGNQNVILVLLNLFRDQLDRYGEVTAIGEKWRDIVETLSPKTKVIINADDPLLASIGKNKLTHTAFFGLGNRNYYIPHVQHATDSIYCPVCKTKLQYTGFYYSHLGDYSCQSCHFAHPKNTIIENDVQSPLEGVYNIYNTLAASAVSLATGISKIRIEQSLSTFTPAFGRMEEVVYKNKKVKILLSKNPTGFNESLRTVLSSSQKGPMMILLNDRIPDGTDVSWIWDVDFEQLHGYQYPIIVSGDRALDMGVRMKYVEVSNIQKKKQHFEIVNNLSEAIDKAVILTKKTETLWVLATYSAMLDVRKIVTGRKIL